MAFDKTKKVIKGVQTATELARRMRNLPPGRPNRNEVLVSAKTLMAPGGLDNVATQRPCPKGGYYVTYR